MGGLRFLPSFCYQEALLGSLNGNADVTCTTWPCSTCLHLSQVGPAALRGAAPGCCMRVLGTGFLWETASHCCMESVWRPLSTGEVHAQM